MAANFEVELISRIVLEGCLQQVLDWGIRAEDFGMGLTRSTFERLVSLYLSPNTMGTVINREAFEKSYPQFKIANTQGLTTDMLCWSVRAEYMRRQGVEIGTKFNEMLETSPGDAMTYAYAQAKTLVELGTAKKVDVDLTGALKRLVRDIEEPEQQTRMRWPWPSIDEKTGGIQESDYIIFYGRPKNLKTWQLICVLAQAFNESKPALAFTKEMTVLQFTRRFAACILHIDYDRIVKRKLGESEKRDIKELLEFVQDPGQNLINFLDASELIPGQDTVSWLQAKIDKYEPAICFVDGLHLLSQEPGVREQADHMRVRYISRQMRQTCLSKKIPIVATVQANRKAAAHSDGNLDEIAYSDAIGQDATLAIRTIKEKHQETVAMVVAGAREMDFHGFRTHRKVAEDLSEHSVLTDDDMRELEQFEAKGRVKPLKRSPGRASEPTEDQIGALIQQQIRQQVGVA